MVREGGEIALVGYREHPAALHAQGVDGFDVCGAEVRQAGGGEETFLVRRVDGGQPGLWGQGGVGAVDVEGRGLADAQRAQRSVDAFTQLRGLQGARHPAAGGFALNGEALRGDLAAAEERLAVAVELGGVDGGDFSFFQRVEKGVDGGGGIVGAARHNRGGAEDEGKWLGHSSWGSAGGWLDAKWKSK